MQTDATSHNIVACCWGFLANSVASVCTGLKVWPVSNYMQQVPTSANKCQHCCGSMQTDATCWVQQCCLLLVNNVASVCMGLKQRGREHQRKRYKTIDFSYRIQSLHVEMQPPGHFSSVVFRNRTWKPQFSSFVENVNVRVRIISIFMQL